MIFCAFPVFAHLILWGIKCWIQVSVYAPMELLDQTDFALDVAKKVLEFYEDYYGIRYPMNKSGEPIATVVFCNLKFFLLIYLIIVTSFSFQCHLKSYLTDRYSNVS